MTKNIQNKIKKYMYDNNIYVDYKGRILFTTLILIIFFLMSVLFLNKSFTRQNEKTISYRENSSLDYKVYLKENEFYDEPYLGKNMTYVASLIDKININFNYIFNIDENVDLDFSYSIIGKLVIQDELGKNTYLEKEYVLLNSKKYNMEDNNTYGISEELDIDYNFYNTLANNFKMTYGVNTTSNLIVYLKIDKNSPVSNNIISDNDSTMSISIPLSEKSVNIELDYNEINEASKLISKSNLVLSNIIFMIFAFASIILTVIFLVKLIKLLLLMVDKKSSYDKYVKKMLTTYDRVIAESYTAPNFENANIIKIKKMGELLDIRDNLKLPIMYYNVISHQKSYFYIKHDSDIYLMVVKVADLKD